MPADLSDLMLVPIDRTGGEPLLRQVYGALRRAILSGALPPGGKLPPTRALAERLGVARNTVVVAYEQLLAEGFIEGRVGAGPAAPPPTPPAERCTRSRPPPHPPLSPPRATGKPQPVYAEAGALFATRAGAAPAESGQGRRGLGELDRLHRVQTADRLPEQHRGQHLVL
ncbi:GntR family transcriptional regulator, partial [Azospirillum baldaniorum]|uniref:GntR family transcriptional regulator n=1 Tax=Azospirillum baldaniorum TaxID=1064539 RepID=UPI001B3BAAFC